MRLVLGVVLAVAALLGPAKAQEAYPSRPVKIIVAFPVGGLLDTVSRLVGDKLSAVLGQQFIIESRPGAGGTLATAAVARAEPDGYTLMMINDNHAVNPSVFKNIPYDSVKDFAPIGFVGSAPMALSATARLSVRTVDELVRLAREQPGKRRSAPGSSATTSRPRCANGPMSSPRTRSRSSSATPNGQGTETKPGGRIGGRHRSSAVPCSRSGLLRSLSPWG